GARYVIVVGDNELATGRVQLKEMATGQSEEIGLDDGLYTTLCNKAVDRQLAQMTDLFSELAMGDENKNESAALGARFGGKA
ncbi:MAG: hypothetical protein J6R77_02980, partial [Clostridia bacterium]|nr:hypothetical protein [Clostridia bacterium]